jgi:hypothetical protein
MWYERQQCEDLKNLQIYNQQAFHGECLHRDRFRYHHKIKDNEGEIHRLTCGTKYDPNDTSQCPVCEAHKYERSESEAYEHAIERFHWTYPRPDPAIRIKRLERWKQEKNNEKLS